MPSSVPTSAGYAEPPNTNERLFDHGCALFFEAALDQPLLALDLMIAMHSGSTEPDSAAPTADPRGVSSRSEAWANEPAYKPDSV